MGALKPHSTDVSDSDWDGPRAKANLSNDEDSAYYKKAFAWFNSDGDPNVKSSYKFIHHMVDANGNIGAANINACITGIAILNGARGGTKIPSSDKQGVWNHLAKHIRDADREAPELRDYINNDLRLREVASSDTRFDLRIEGYAPVYNVEADSLDMREIFRPGSAKPVDDVVLTLAHDRSIILARTGNGSLKLEDDGTGLKFTGILPDTQSARDAWTLIRDRYIAHTSFAYLPIIMRAVPDNIDSDGRQLFEVLDAEIHEITVTAFPAYKDSTVDVRDDNTTAYNGESMKRGVSPLAGAGASIIGPHNVDNNDETDFISAQKKLLDIISDSIKAT